MLRLSQKQCAALEAVIHIACSPGGDPVSGKALSEKLDQPSRYLEPVLQKLVHHGLLRGVRGPRGGYVLAKERRRLHVRDICEALTEEEILTPQRVSPLGRKIITPICDRALGAAFAQMENITLADLCEQVSDFETTDQPKPDFTI